MMGSPFSFDRNEIQENRVWIVGDDHEVTIATEIRKLIMEMLDLNYSIDYAQNVFNILTEHPRSFETKAFSNSLEQAKEFAKAYPVLFNKINFLCGKIRYDTMFGDEETMIVNHIFGWTTNFEEITDRFNKFKSNDKKV